NFNTSIPGVYSYYVTQTVDGCESDRTLVLIKVNEKPKGPDVISPMYFCLYDDNKVIPVTGENLRWYDQPTGGLGAVATPTLNTSYIDTFEYYVTQTINGCESDRVKLEVIIIKKPTGIIM